MFEGSLGHKARYCLKTNPKSQTELRSRARQLLLRPPTQLLGTQQFTGGMLIFNLIWTEVTFTDRGKPHSTGENRVLMYGVRAQAWLFSL